MAVFTANVFFPGDKNLCHDPITFPVDLPNSWRLARDKRSMARDKPVSKLVSTGRFVCKICYELKLDLKLKKILFFAASRVLNRLRANARKENFNKMASNRYVDVCCSIAFKNHPENDVLENYYGKIV